MNPGILAARSGLAGAIVTAGMLLASTASAQAPPKVPLRDGLTIVTAVNDTRGDYESIKTFTTVNDKEVRLKYSAEAPPAGDDSNPLAALFGGGGTKPAPTTSKDKPTQHVTTTRRIPREDLKSSHEYQHFFRDGGPELYPGSTAIGVSAAVLTELKTAGETKLRVPAGGLVGALGGLLGGLLGGSSKELDEATMLAGTLKRVERGTVPFSVLLNDEPVTLQAVHARGTLGEEVAEFWILDDPDNPIALKWTLGHGQLQVVKLSYPAAPTTTAAKGAGSAAGAPTADASVGRIERALEEEGRAVVYGIYFDFASDTIKEESEPVLKEIAQVMTNNAAWTLTVEGHTDSIGADGANLDLSQRRAAAVRQALGARYKVPAARLVPAGFGESRPKDTNDTLEGRARNRRVELARVNGK